MKKIYLMRHSIPQKVKMDNKMIPLSDEGVSLAKIKSMSFSNIDKCYSSSYKRAFETAELIADKVTIIDALQERIIGDAYEDFWLKQYEDHDFHNENGESLNEVKFRMKSAIELILNNLSEGESALVVSHATAICAYLLNYCSIEVTDASRKIRKISRENQTIFDGIFSYASYFEIVYEGNDFVSIHYSDMF